MRNKERKIKQTELSRVLVIGKAIARDNIDPEEFLKTQNWDERRIKSFWVGYRMKREMMEKKDDDDKNMS